MGNRSITYMNGLLSINFYPTHFIQASITRNVTMIYLVYTHTVLLFSQKKFVL